VQTLTSKMNLANLLKNEGTAEAVAEAKALYREVVAGRTAHYGAQHVETLTSKMNLAILLETEGTAEAVAEAKALYREVVAGFTAHYGAQHVRTLASKMNLANLLKNEGTAEAVAEAKALYREVVAGFTAHHGATHQRSVRARAQLEACTQWLQMPAEERQRWKRLRQVSKAAFDRRGGQSDDDVQAERAAHVQLVGMCWGDATTTFFLSACAPGPILGSGFNTNGPFAVAGEWTEDDNVCLVVTNRFAPFELRMRWSAGEEGGGSGSSALIGVAEGNEGEVTLHVVDA
jgi:hypothetical protein